MTPRQSEIIELIKKDNITIFHGTNLGSPGKYDIDSRGNCYITIDTDILMGNHPIFPEKRIELVFYHEWGHILDYRKDNSRFLKLNSINPCHEDLEFEAYRHALQIAFNESYTGEFGLLEEAVKRYEENIKIDGLNEGYKKALLKIFETCLWKDSKLLLNNLK